VEVVELVVRVELLALLVHQGREILVVTVVAASLMLGAAGAVLE
jgi:hypothetical protein